MENYGPPPIGEYRPDGRNAARQPDILRRFRHLPLIGDRFGANRSIDMRGFAFRRDGYERYMKLRWEQAWYVAEKYLFQRYLPILAVIPRSIRV